MRAPRASGFVLIGVVMFVLALTILGLSLYSLSNYEAAFLEQSHDTNAALYRAQGGMDLVKAILASPPYRLESAANAVGWQGVLSARAYQRRAGGGLDSSGTVNWDSLVTVTVTAQRGSVSRTLRATWRPQARRSLYKRLFTVSGSTVMFDDGTGLRSYPGGVFVDAPWQMIRSQDVVSRTWQNTADSSWRDLCLWTSPRPQLFVGSVPAPDVPSYYAAHPPTKTPVVSGGGGTEIHVSFNSGGVYGDATPYKNADWSFDTGKVNADDVELRVTGQVIWVLPKGFFAYHRVTVRSSGGGSPTLVIVTSPNAFRTTGERDAGFMLDGGLSNTDGVNLILVSDGRVDLEQNQNSGTPFTADRMAVYAAGVTFGGPATGTPSRFDYDPAVDAAIDALEADDLLPHGVGAVAATAYALIKGSWQDLTP